jgi:hypothetical protein
MMTDVTQERAKRLSAKKSLNPFRVLLPFFLVFRGFHPRLFIFVPLGDFRANPERIQCE